MRRRQTPRAYRLYGLRVRSPWPLPSPAAEGPGLGAVDLIDVPSAGLAEASWHATARRDGNDWFRYRRLQDGSDYARWSGLFEFVVSPDGGRIACRALDGASTEMFQTYLLGQVLSFALLKRGIEPLHATAVVVRGAAVAFVGNCGQGKSSLGAAFLQAGHALLTDDLLVVRPAAGGVAAYPGPPRIKLFPDVARRLLGPRTGVTPMNPLTAKRVIPLPLPGGAPSPAAVPLRAIYVLRPRDPRARGRGIAIRRLSTRRACLELLRNTFNTVVVEPARLRRQLTLVARLARTIPVKSLAFPRGLARLPAVREAIEADLFA